MGKVIIYYSDPNQRITKKEIIGISLVQFEKSTFQKNKKAITEIIKKYKIQAKQINSEEKKYNPKNNKEAEKIITTDPTNYLEIIGLLNHNQINITLEKYESGELFIDISLHDKKWLQQPQKTKKLLIEIAEDLIQKTAAQSIGCTTESLIGTPELLAQQTNKEKNIITNTLSQEDKIREQLHKSILNELKKITTKHNIELWD